MAPHKDTSAVQTPGVVPRILLHDLRPCDVGVIAEALFILPAIQLAVRLVGLQRTLGWISGLVAARGKVAAPGASTAEIERIVHLIRGTCRRLPFRASCLDRSLVAVALLGRRAVPVEICIGFRKSDADVQGHAWVEHGSHPLAEIEDTTTIARLVWQHQRPSTGCS